MHLHQKAMVRFEVWALLEVITEQQNYLNW